MKPHPFDGPLPPPSPLIGMCADLNCSPVAPCKACAAPSSLTRWTDRILIAACLMLLTSAFLRASALIGGAGIGGAG